MKIFERLMDSIAHACDDFYDKRKTTKNQKYSMRDIGLAAFSMFFTQCESFLQYQRRFVAKGIRSNCETLFGIAKIPTDTHIRQMLDEVDPSSMGDAFSTVIAEFTRFKASSGNKHAFSQLGGRTLIALDGTEYFQSRNISCDRCLKRKRSDGEIDCYHSMLAATIVAPGTSVAIPLMPEPITNSDGSDKQDCETNAAKRWFEKNADAVRSLKPVILGDGLYANQPMIDTLMGVDDQHESFDFIFVCKPDSKTTIYESLESSRIYTRTVKGDKGKTYTYRWAKNLPLRQNDTTYVDWAEITITNASGKRTYKNAFITSLGVAADNVMDIVAAGRARWKCENEGFNVLKNHGYNFEHNYGHGDKYLAQVFATMNLLAYAFHSILDIAETKWQQARESSGKRTRFFIRLESRLELALFASWEVLMDSLIGRGIPPGATLLPT
jgi:hypothetical protein